LSIAIVDTAYSQQLFNTRDKPSPTVSQAAGNTGTSADAAAPACPGPKSSAFAEASELQSIGNHPAAFPRLLVLAECGDSRAQQRIGNYYVAGKGVPQSFEEAHAWYLKAAQQGNVEAQFNLGVLYFKGLGVPKDIAASRNWYLKAAQQGHAGAENALGEMLDQGLGGERDSAEALRWFFQAAEQDNAHAQNSIGFAYAAGRGTGKNYIEAHKWFLKSAEQGLAQAQYHLATLYRNGGGVKRDHAEAYRWYLKAANQGHSEAQYHVALLYRNGEGVPPSYAEAIGWCFKAAKQGHALSQFRMAEAHLNLALFGARNRTDFVLAHMWAAIAEQKACAEAPKICQGASDQCPQQVVCKGAPTYRAVAAHMMKADEITQAQKFAREWEVGANTTIAPAPEALLALPTKMPPIPSLSRPKKPGDPVILAGGKIVVPWLSAPMPK
jgi:TPR repeat protein